MKSYKLALAGAAVLTGPALLAVLPGVPAASADTGISVTLGTPTVSARLLVTVPVSVVCSDIPGTISTEDDMVTVNIQQAAGQGVATATGQIMGGTFAGNAGLFTCDGSTINNFTMSLVADSPIHGGQAVATVTAAHVVSTDPYCGWCGTVGESTTLGPETVLVK